jgi:hypothetical protein
MKLKKIFAAATLLLSITSSQAALVESDWLNTGDTLATLDTETGIEWLDLTQTYSMSINQVDALLGTTLAGWRLPTHEEVRGLMGAAFVGYEGALTPNTVTSLPGAGFNLGHFMGLSGGFFNYTHGLHTNQNGQVVESGLMFRGDLQTSYIRSEVLGGYSTGTSISTAGVFLVSDGGTTLSSQLDPSINANNTAAPINDVSAPALLGMMSLGLFGLAARRRIKR